MVDFEKVEYIKEKVKVLKQLGVRVTDELKLKMLQCRNEIQIDNIAHDLIFTPGGSAPWTNTSQRGYQSAKQYVKVS